MTNFTTYFLTLVSKDPEIQARVVELAKEMGMVPVVPVGDGCRSLQQYAGTGAEYPFSCVLAREVIKGVRTGHTANFVESAIPSWLMNNFSQALEDSGLCQARLVKSSLAGGYILALEHK